MLHLVAFLDDFSLPNHCLLLGRTINHFTMRILARFVLGRFSGAMELGQLGRQPDLLHHHRDFLLAVQDLLIPLQVGHLGEVSLISLSVHAKLEKLLVQPPLRADSLLHLILGHSCRLVNEVAVQLWADFVVVVCVLLGDIGLLGGVDLLFFDLF